MFPLGRLSVVKRIIFLKEEKFTTFEFLQFKGTPFSLHLVVRLAVEGQITENA
jgi:hypothetical protein